MMELSNPDDAVEHSKKDNTVILQYEGTAYLAHEVPVCFAAEPHDHTDEPHDHPQTDETG